VRSAQQRAALWFPRLTRYCQQVYDTCQRFQRQPTTMLHSRVAPSLASIGAVLLTLSCAPQPQKPVAAPPTMKAASPVEAELADAHWGRFVSQRFGLSIPLPDGHAWRIDDHSSGWLVARHPPTQSVFRARTWREPELMNRTRCEAGARSLLASIPEVAGSQIIDERELGSVPSQGFDTHLVVGIVARPSRGSPSEPLQGFVLAFGASVRRCAALVFLASVAPPNSSRRMGDLLGLGTRVVEQTRLRSALEPTLRDAAP
jgi:hypothetical protein